jgi:hypothetical protein
LPISLLHAVLNKESVKAHVYVSAPENIFVNLICCGQVKNGTWFKGRLKNISCHYSSPTSYEKFNVNWGKFSSESRLSGFEHGECLHKVLATLLTTRGLTTCEAPSKPSAFIDVREIKQRHAKRAGIQTLYHERRALQYVATRATLPTKSSLSAITFSTSSPIS